MQSSRMELEETPSAVYYLGRKPENMAARVKQLQAEATMMAREQVKELQTAMAALAVMANEVADGGDVIPPGVRDLSSRMADDLHTRSLNMQALMERSRGPR